MDGSSRHQINQPPLLLLRQWCQVMDGILGAMGVIEEIKSPCGGRDF
jgi:hypothetical protein